MFSGQQLSQNDINDRKDGVEKHQVHLVRYTGECINI
jgi:hypothetical protein